MDLKIPLNEEIWKISFWVNRKSLQVAGENHMWSAAELLKQTLFCTQEPPMKPTNSSITVLPQAVAPQAVH